MKKRLFPLSIVLFALTAVLAASYLCAQPQSMAGSGAVVGRVFEIGSNAPVAGAAICVRRQSDNSVFKGISGSDGTFFLSPLPQGRYTIHAVKEGFQECFISDFPVRIRGQAAEPAQIGLAATSALQSATKNVQVNQVLVHQAESESSMEVHIKWNVGHHSLPLSNTQAPLQNVSADSFSLLKLRQIPGAAPRQRVPELSPDQILIFVVDDSGVERDWTLIGDPRIIRGESTGPYEELGGHVSIKQDAEFTVVIPANILASGLKFYQPNWTGKNYSLELLGTLSLK